MLIYVVEKADAEICFEGVNVLKPEIIYLKIKLTNDTAVDIIKM